jgi:hypothetical protein
MNFEQHLFISYAILDNRPLRRGETGWISRFHEALDALLSMRLGRAAKIWRDEKLSGNDVLSEEIIARLKQSAALVSILTPRYFESEWCTREVGEFCQYAQETVGLAVANKSRIFKILKMPLEPKDQQKLPPPMKDALGYEFFTDEGKGPLELDAAYGPRYAELHNAQVALLALEIATTVRTLEADRGGKTSDEPKASGKPAVYLAECSFDQKPERGLLEGELRRLGYPVFPDKPLPQDEPEYVAAVKDMLARCALSIHLVGRCYGKVPDGPSVKSASMHQNELAVERCNGGGLKRLIWLPEGTRSDQPDQQAFIDALHHDARAQFGADLIAGDIEQLRAAIHATLKKIEQPEAPQSERIGAESDAGGKGEKLLYVICVEKDRKATVPLRKLCKQLGIEVVLPTFEGDASAIRQANQQLLASCDAVLLYYGAGEEAWKHAVDSELRKVGGYRVGKPMPPIFTYLAEPKTSGKEDLIDMEEPGLINGLSGLAEAAITKCIQDMTARRAAA